MPTGEQRHNGSRSEPAHRRDSQPDKSRPVAAGGPSDEAKDNDSEQGEEARSIDATGEHPIGGPDANQEGGKKTGSKAEG